MASPSSSAALCGLLNGVIVTVGRIEPFIVDARHDGHLPRAHHLHVGRRHHPDRPQPARSLPPGLFRHGRRHPDPDPHLARGGARRRASCSTDQVRPPMRRRRRQRRCRALSRASRSSGSARSPIVIQGVCVAIAAICYVPRLGAATPTTGLLWELQVITAVVIGGTALRGGKGRIWGTVAGAVILELIANLMVLSDLVSEYLVAAVQGVIIIIAMLIQRFIRNRPAPDHSGRSLNQEVQHWEEYIMPRSECCSPPPPLGALALAAAGAMAAGQEGHRRLDPGRRPRLDGRRRLPRPAGREGDRGRLPEHRRRRQDLALGLRAGQRARGSVGRDRNIDALVILPYSSEELTGPVQAGEGRRHLHHRRRPRPDRSVDPGSLRRRRQHRRRREHREVPRRQARRQGRPGRAARHPDRHRRRAHQGLRGRHRPASGHQDPRHPVRQLEQRRRLQADAGLSRQVPARSTRSGRTTTTCCSACSRRSRSRAAPTSSTRSAATA